MVKGNITGMHTVRVCTLTHPRAEPGCEVVKDEVGVGLRHSSYVRDIVPHYHVVKCEISCGSKWQVAHHQAICKYTETK